MRIGEVATEAGVNVQTLRYYERRGLLDPPPRTPSGYRIYAMDTVRLVRFIKRVQELGFTLTDVEDLLSLRDDPDPSAALAVAREKLAGIRARLRDLQAMDAALTHLVSVGTVNTMNAEELLVSALEESPAAAK
jgi:MerR family mercuric resistance operon transcriptional regulator